MSARPPPRPGVPGGLPVRAAARPGAPPQQPGVQPGARPMQAVGSPRPMMPGARPGMVPQAGAPGVRPMSPRPGMPPQAMRPVGQPQAAAPGARMVGAQPGVPQARPPVAGVPPQAAPRPPMRPPGQAMMQPARPGLAPQSPTLPRPVSPAGAPMPRPMQVPPGQTPPAARPAGLPRPGAPMMMARPGVPGQVSPQRPVAGAIPGQGVPPAARLASPAVRPPAGVPTPMMRPATGATSPIMRPAAGVPTPGMRPAAGAAAPIVRPAAGAAAPIVRPPAGAASPIVRPAAGAAAPIVTPAARPAGPAVRPAAGVAAPVVRPSAGVGAPVVRPAAGVAAAPIVRPAAGVPAPAVRPAPAVAAPVVRPAAGMPASSPQAAVPPRPVPGPAQTAPAPPRPVPGPTPPQASPGRGFALPQQTAPAQIRAPAEAPAPPAEPAAAPIVEKMSSGELNMDDIRETFRQVFGGTSPEPSQRAPPGADGTACKVLVNMYPVQLPRGSVFHYDVEVFSAAKQKAEGTTPVPTQKRARCASTLVNRKVIDAFSRCYRSELGNCILAFDGRKNMYTRRLLPKTDQTYNNVEAEVNGEMCLFVVRINYVATVSFDALHAMYENSIKGVEQFQNAIQVADVILRTGPTLEFVPVGRSFFSTATKPINLTGNREVWFGFYSSIRLGAWKPLVNIDMSATAFYVAAPLIDFATDVLKKRNKADLKTGLNDRERVLMSRELRTLRVTVTHMQTTRQYRIEGLRQKPANQETFEMEGRQITVAQYFAEKYNRPLEYPNLPCVATGKGNTYLPMEVCTLVKGQHCKKKLNEMQTSNMIRQTALVPKERFERIKNSVQQLKTTSAQICKEFDMVFETNPLEIEARILKAPAITLGSNKKQLPRDGVWKCDTFLRAAKMGKWAIAVLGRLSADKPKKMIDLFQNEGGKLGMSVAPPCFVNTYGAQAKPRTVLEDIKNKHPEIEMTVVVLDTRSDYGAIKAEAETTDLCMRTQCVKDRNVETKFNSMFAVNLLQKINTKMGGRNNGVFLPNAPKTLGKPYMAIGVDVNHPAPGDTTPSIAAFVASMDAIPSQYYACTSVQLSRKGSRSEYVVETKSMFLECLTEFQKRNNTLPAHIFIFRDGVADAQFDAVRIFELGAIRKACLELRSDYTPGMTFIVVQKRHHVRFMPSGGDRGHGKTGNVHAGTIVDSKIINPAIFDFYLCSHQGIQGTSRAAHYHVVHDDANHTQDEIYKICYNLCHTYARCPRAVSIPAPAYYAHLAAFRAKEHIKGRAQHSGTYAESNTGSVRSSSSSEPDLDKFQAAQKVLTQMRGSMYFV